MPRARLWIKLGLGLVDRHYLAHARHGAASGQRVQHLGKVFLHQVVGKLAPPLGRVAPDGVRGDEGVQLLAELVEYRRRLFMQSQGRGG